MNTGRHRGGRSYIASLMIQKMLLLTFLKLSDSKQQGMNTTDAQELFCRPYSVDNERIA